MLTLTNTVVLKQCSGKSVFPINVRHPSITLSGVRVRLNKNSLWVRLFRRGVILSKDCFFIAKKFF